jgi:hypothetical protein
MGQFNVTLFGLSILGKSTPLSGNVAEVSISGPRDPAIRSHVSACADSADTEIDGRFNRKMPLEPCDKPIGTLRTRLSLRSLICDIGRPAADVLIHHSR